jgi:hypothetical protein
MAIKQCAHHAYPTLPEDHIRREAGKAFADRVEDPTINIQLLLGGEKTVNEALRLAFKLQAILLASRPQKRAPGYFGGTDRPKPCEQTKDDWCAGAMGNQATTRLTAPTEGRQKTTIGMRNEMTDL